MWTPDHHTLMRFFFKLLPRTLKTWFAKAVVKELEWPAWSTDLNPTEHFLDKLKHSFNIGA